MAEVPAVGICGNRFQENFLNTTPVYYTVAKTAIAAILLGAIFFLGLFSNRVGMNAVLSKSLLGVLCLIGITLLFFSIRNFQTTLSSATTACTNAQNAIAPLEAELLQKNAEEAAIRTKKGLLEESRTATENEIIVIEKEIESAQRNFVKTEQELKESIAQKERKRQQFEQEAVDAVKREQEALWQATYHKQQNIQLIESERKRFQDSLQLRQKLEKLEANRG